jgi:hypothetical protein
MTIQVTVGLTTQTLENGQIVPAFSVPKINVTLPKEQIKIKISGNTEAYIADAFKGFFMGEIRDQITSNL